jgi:transcription elongation factor GreB
MSRAFIKEDAMEELSPTRLVAPLPDGAVNYVTPRGLLLLRETVSNMEDALANEASAARQTNLRQALDELRYRALSAKVIDLSADPPAQIRFGATVSLKGEDGRTSTVTLVGVDEADPASGRISFYGVLGQALVGKGTGAVVCVDTEEREVTWTVVSIAYAA